MNLIEILVPNEKNFYTLYSDGLETFKQAVPSGTLFTYPPKSIIILYYTYPTHRRAYVVRYVESPNTQLITLPGVSLPVKELIRVHASKVDKLKKSISYLKEHTHNVYQLSDSFFIRLHYLLQKKGKVNYESLKALINLMGDKIWI